MPTRQQSKQAYYKFKCQFYVIMLLVSGIYTNSVIAKPDNNYNDNYKMHPAMDSCTGTNYAFKGVIDEYLKGVSTNWLLGAIERNPMVLDMLSSSSREEDPPRWLVPWAGEFAGKYLTGAVQILRLTHDEQLKTYLAGFVDRLIALQAKDGYLGAWGRQYRLTGKAPKGSVWGGEDCTQTCDLWNHYHIMLGLLLWHEETGDIKAFDAARKIGDLMVDKFLGKIGSVIDVGVYPMNLAPVHSLALLYIKTKDDRYLQLAQQIIHKEYPKGEDYFQNTLANYSLYP